MKRWLRRYRERRASLAKMRERQAMLDKVVDPHARLNLLLGWAEDPAVEEWSI